MTQRNLHGHSPYCPPVPGIPDDYPLEKGMAVMVAAGVISAEVNGQPPLICYATVLGLAAADDKSVYKGAAGEEPGEVWWLDVRQGPVALPQMYRRSEILGIPAYGLNPGPEATIGTQPAPAPAPDASTPAE